MQAITQFLPVIHTTGFSNHSRQAFCFSSGSLERLACSTVGTQHTANASKGPQCYNQLKCSLNVVKSAVGGRVSSNITLVQIGNCRDPLNGFVGRLKIVEASYDNEFRSLRSIALGLHRRYKDVMNGGFSNNLREFISAGVTAYAVGCTDEGLRKELLSATVDGDGHPDGSRIGLKSKLTVEEVEECILWLSIVFITILCTPQPTIVRWSSMRAVSPDAELKWHGFCSLIANAYYTRGMAWLPVKTLQMEQMAVTGYAEEPSLVADRMRIVFLTLEVVSPQWPKR